MISLVISLLSCMLIVASSTYTQETPTAQAGFTEVTLPPTAPKYGPESQRETEKRDAFAPDSSSPVYEGPIPSPLPQLKDIPEIPQKRVRKNKKKKLISFDFENEDLSTIINKFAALENINIIQPQGANAINQKITFKLDKKITLEEAERYLDTFLDLAGYNKVPHGDFYMIIKSEVRGDRNIANLEPLPLYIGVAPDLLPDSGRIRVVYYFRNLKVPTTNTGNDPLHAILNDMLSSTQSYSFDSKSNGVIIADKAPNIKAVMSMLLELDSMGLRDVLKQVRLFNTASSTVADLLQKQIIAVSGDQQGRIKADVKSESGLFFAPGTKVIADNRTNSLIIMGKEPAVERIIEFVQEYIDVPIESGKSILHYYDLQYLDSESFAPILTKIVSAQTSGESGQATSEASGPTRAFDGVIVVPEKLVEEKITAAKLAELKKTGAAGVELKGTVYRGGNRIIVAARNRDWVRIEKLIHDLDKPQRQVILQVMIVDFAASQSKIFGTQTRNPSLLNLPPGFSFQTSFLAPTPPLKSPVILPETNPSTLATDLLLLLSGNQGAPNPPQSVASVITQLPDGVGSLILSLSDPNGSGIWTFLQWLDTFGSVKVLSHPYIIALNNRKAEEVVSAIQRGVGPATTGEGGVIAAKEMDIEAALRLAFVPRASSNERVNLQISIAVNDFSSPTSALTATTSPFNITTREIHTNVNMGSGQMLVIGGLSRTLESEDAAETPLLGRIPILGWFFKKEDQAAIKTNVSVFIIPTIVEPKIRAGMNKYSRDKIDHAFTLDETEVFSQLRDPVNYLFFTHEDQSASSEMLEEYLSESNGDFVVRKKNNHGRKPCSRIEPEPPLAKHESYCKLPKKPHCKKESSCSKDVKAEPVITKESDKLKSMLAAEENPILALTPP